MTNDIINYITAHPWSAIPLLLLAVIGLFKTIKWLYCEVYYDIYQWMWKLSYVVSTNEYDRNRLEKLEDKFSKLANRVEFEMNKDKGEK